MCCTLLGLNPEKTGLGGCICLCSTCRQAVAGEEASQARASANNHAAMFRPPWQELNCGAEPATPS